MTDEKQIIILNVSEETKKAAAVLMEKPYCPFTSLEDCLASLMTYRMMLKASGENTKVHMLDNTYHLSNLTVFYKPLVTGE